jgi:hypothetical protein
MGWGSATCELEDGGVAAVAHLSDGLHSERRRMRRRRRYGGKTMDNQEANGGNTCMPPSSHKISFMSGFHVESLARAAAAAAAAAEKAASSLLQLLMEMRGPRKSASPTAWTGFSACGLVLEGIGSGGCAGV